MSSIVKVLLVLVIIIIQSCAHKTATNFEKHVKKADEVLWDEMVLHPTYLYVKENKVIGIKFEAKPECGDYYAYYYLKENEQLDRIEIREDFFDTHCMNNYDSTFVININKNEILAYSSNNDTYKTKSNKWFKELYLKSFKEIMMNTSNYKPFKK